ncbi:uncharacterized protein METZ01_LOCUS514967, partial [marine metagenome]
GRDAVRRGRRRLGRAGRADPLRRVGKRPETGLSRTGEQPDAGGGRPRYAALRRVGCCRGRPGGVHAIDRFRGHRLVQLLGARRCRARLAAQGRCGRGGGRSRGHRLRAGPGRGPGAHIQAARRRQHNPGAPAEAGGDARDDQRLGGVHPARERRSQGQRNHPVPGRRKAANPQAQLHQRAAGRRAGCTVPEPRGVGEFQSAGQRPRGRAAGRVQDRAGHRRRHHRRGA